MYLAILFIGFIIGILVHALYMRSKLSYLEDQAVIIKGMLEKLLQDVDLSFTDSVTQLVYIIDEFRSGSTAHLVSRAEDAIKQLIRIKQEYIE